MTRWEYFVFDGVVAGALSDLNARGDEGWELVAVVGNRYFLKREKLSAQEIATRIDAATLAGLEHPARMRGGRR